MCLRKVTVRKVITEVMWGHFFLDVTSTGNEFETTCSSSCCLLPALRKVRKGSYLHFLPSLFLSLTLLMANRQISGLPQRSWLTFQSLHVYYSHCQSATCHCLMSTLILKPATVQQPQRQRASWRGEGTGCRTRRLCCDHDCVWHYVNSAYPVLIASTARMSILNVKKTIYHHSQATVNKAGSGFCQNCICYLCHLICTLKLHWK